jgi:hypothetical protein
MQDGRAEPAAHQTTVARNGEAYALEHDLPNCEGSCEDHQTEEIDKGLHENFVSRAEAGCVASVCEDAE